MDEEGYPYLCDRRKDVIIVDEAAVYSIKVENILSQSNAIEKVVGGDA